MKKWIFLNKNSYVLSVSLTTPHFAKLPSSSTVYTNSHHVSNLLTSVKSFYLRRWNQEKGIEPDLPSTKYVISDNKLKRRGYI